MNLHPLVKLFLYPLILTALGTFVANVPQIVALIPMQYTWLAMPVVAYLAALAAHAMKSPIFNQAPPPPPPVQ